MEIRTRIHCREANTKDIVDYLNSLGYQPEKIRNQNYWYKSPLRNEKTASFKVDRKLNRWYDFGTGRGGTLIDFATLYHDCNVREFLDILNGFVGSLKSFTPTPELMVQHAKITITGEHVLSSIPLLRYLQDRRINGGIADRFCKEVNYRIDDKSYYAIGFKNDQGGYELRNRYFKGNSHPKGVTTIKKGSLQVSVFEGFFDFLSYCTMDLKSTLPETDFLILNSLSFFEKSLESLLAYDKIHLFLNNDKAGQNCSHQACSTDKKFIDESELYKNYNDLNDLLLGKRANPLRLHKRQ